MCPHLVPTNMVIGQLVSQEIRWKCIKVLACGAYLEESKPHALAISVDYEYQLTTHASISRSNGRAAWPSVG